MPKLTRFQTSFEYGEISPRLLACVDLNSYQKAVKTMRNAYSLIHGGATRRRGTVFIGALKNESQKAKLIPFVFDDTRRFMLVLNGGHLQILKEGAFVETTPGTRYELAIPYTEAELKKVQYAQAGNTLYLVHPNHPPKLLQRITDTNWTLADIAFDYFAVSDVTFSNAYISFKIINGTQRFNTGDYFTIGTTAGAISSISGPTLGGGTPPGNGQIGGVISMPGSTTTETWTITCVLSTPTRQEWSVVGSVSGSPPAYWNAGNYPQTVAFFEQRLFFGGSPQYPQHVWASAAGDYSNLSVGNRDSDAVINQIAGNDYNEIIHLVPARNLLPLTTSAEFSFAGPSNYAISGLSSNVVKDHTRHGSNYVKPMRVGREVLFLQREGKKLRAISYSVTEDVNVAPDITLLSEHFTRSTTFIDMGFAADPDYVAWLIRSDGKMASLTLAREFDTTAWALHETDGQFESIATTPGEIATDTYMVVKRTIDGTDRRYVEIFDYEDTDTVYTDCSAYYSGSPITTVSGLDHLEGKTVDILADGTVHPQRVVTGGEITLEAESSTIIVGLPTSVQIELLNPEFGDSSATSQARAVSVTEITVRFQDTVNCKINGVVIPFRTTLNNLNTGIEPFTGDKKVKSLGWRSPNNILLTNDTPTPFTVLGVIIEAQVN